MDSYLPHVGFVQFPRSPGDLTSTVCPACFAPRSAARCPRCALDLTNPAIAELDTASQDASAALDRRLELIGRIRYESTLAAAPVPAPVAPTPEAPAPAAPPAVPQRSEIPTEAPPRRHLGVQVILLIVGVSLLAVGAIFFLVYAFITFGLVWRSVIIGAVTVAAFVAASLLRRRRLGATAEAIAALAVVFVYLDAFALRANDLFGLGGSDALVYWGVALLLSSVGFAVWHRLSGLRLPSVVAFIAFPPAVALLVGGLTEPLDDAVRGLAAFLGLAVAALAHPLTRGKAVERTITLGFAAIGLVVAAFFALWVEPSADAAPLLGLGLVVLAVAAHVLLLMRLAVARPFAVGLACFGAVVAASAFVAVAVRVADIEFTVTVPVIAAAVVALALELVARRARSSVALGAAWSAAAVAALILLVPVVTSLVRAIGVAVLGTRRWWTTGGTPLDVEPDHVLGLAAVLGVLVLAAASWALGGTLRARRLVVVSAALGLLVLAVPLTGQLWLAVLSWLVLGAASVGLLIVARRRGWGAGIRIALVATGLISLALAYSASWASIDTWWYASVGSVVLLVVARAATDLVPLRAALLGGATVLAFVAAGSEAWHTNERFQGGGDAAVDTVHAVLFLAILLIGLAALLSRRLSSPETRVLFWLAFAAALVGTGLSAVATGFSGSPALVFPEWWTSALLGVLLLGALVLWLVRSPFALERIGASVALAPVAAWLADSLFRLLVLPDFMFWIAPLLACLVVAAVSLALSSRGSRGARDLGVAAVGAPLLISAVIVSRADVTWLALVVGGVATLLVAVSRDGLFASASPRKHLGWLALALAFGGLAWTLADRDVTALEPYVLPLTGALLLVALLTWRTNRTDRAPAFIALGALLVSIVPLGAVSATGPLARTVIVAGVSAVLLLLGSWRRGSVYYDVAAVAGAAGVLVAGLARPVALAIDGRADDAGLDLWLAATLLVLLAAAVGQARSTDPRRGLAGEIVACVALLLVAVIEIPGLHDDTLGTARTVVILVVYAALYVAGMLAERSPFTRNTGWAAFALAAVVFVVGLLSGSIDPFEWGTGILALALLIVGAVTLSRRAEAGSWPWLAPGLLVLLLPSLATTLFDQPIWRLVGIGVVCVAAIVVGALLKLQAPLLIGTVVVLIHAIRTFSPQLVAVYQLTEWWVWAVIGGAIIIFVAVTFERRMRDLKSVGGRIAALR